jgi:ketosteroid isomerase-like protein
MYHAIVKRRIRFLIAEVNRGNPQAVVDALAPKFVYRFIGDTPLGGTRTRRESMQAWFARIFELVPDATLHAQDILVEGFPWNTRIMTYVKFRGTLPAVKGQPAKAYENEVMQLMHLKWGKLHSVLTLEDSLRFDKILPRLSAAGISAASAEPISDVL